MSLIKVVELLVAHILVPKKSTNPTPERTRASISLVGIQKSAIQIYLAAQRPEAPSLVEAAQK